MVRTSTVILWDCNGKLEATLFCSRRQSFNLEPVKDQMGMIAVKVSTTISFDAERDYLVRQVKKNGRIDNQLVFGRQPRWTGGTLLTGRCLLACGADTTRLLSSSPEGGYEDREIRRHNGVNKSDEDCCGM